MIHNNAENHEDSNKLATVNGLPAILQLLSNTVQESADAQSISMSHWWRRGLVVRTSVWLADFP